LLALEAEAYGRTVEEIQRMKHFKYRSIEDSNSNVDVGVDVDTDLIVGLEVDV
jgi:hypothetical protein